MRGFLESIPLIGNLFKDTADIIKEVVVDKDKQNAILEKLEFAKQNIEQELHAAELKTKTIPWVDALHKMGRQILNLITIISVVAINIWGSGFSPEEILAITGGNVAYQIIKGKGRK